MNLITAMYVLLMMVIFSLQVSASTVSEKEIVALAQKYGYEDPFLVVAIAKIESSYNAKAFNGEGSGSYGLMQVQCDTAKSPVFGDDALTGKCDQLFDPDINVKYGIKWLEYVEDSLQIKSIRNIMAGYNAGFDVNNKKCELVENNRCIKYLYGTRRCTRHNTFIYEGYPPQVCQPGQYINETYVRKLFKTHLTIKKKLGEQR